MPVGIIAEYNPFHNGHKLHIQKTKAIINDDIIAVISGNYVQRGEPALTDKWLRTKMALENGADIVLELPAPFATASAEFFASYAIKTLDATGIVNHISFGSECGDISALYSIAEILSNEPELYKSKLKEFLGFGLSYPQARSRALEETKNIDADIINNPNNILAIEYIKYIIKSKSNIIPFTIQREKAGYYDKHNTDGVSSATGIRAAIAEKNLDFVKNAVPQNVYDMLTNALEEGLAPVTLDSLSQAFNYKIRSVSKEYIKNIQDITEGLENRILSSESWEISTISREIKTKRYPLTKIQRSMLHILLDITKSDFIKYYNLPLPYVRVLGFKKEKSALLGKLTQECAVPVVTNINKLSSDIPDYGLEMLALEAKSTDIYFSAIPNKSYSKMGQEFTKPLVII